MREINLGTMLVRLTGDSSSFNRMMGGAESRLQKFSRVMSRVGRDLTVFVTLPLVGLGAAAIKTFANFEEATAKADAALGGLSDTMSDAVRTMAKGTSTSATELMGALEDLGKAGYYANDAMSTLPAINDIMIASDVKHGQAVKLLINSYRELGSHRTMLLLAQQHEIAQKKMGTTTKQLEMMRNRFEDVAMQVGERLLPALKWVEDKLQSIIKWWDHLTDSTRSFVLLVVGAFAAAGPIILGLTGVITLMNLVLAPFNQWLAIVILIGDAIKELSTGNREGLLGAIQNAMDPQGNIKGLSFLEQLKTGPIEGILTQAFGAIKDMVSQAFGGGVSAVTGAGASSPSDTTQLDLVRQGRAPLSSLNGAGGTLNLEDAKVGARLLKKYGALTTSEFSPTWEGMVHGRDVNTKRLESLLRAEALTRSIQAVNGVRQGPLALRYTTPDMVSAPVGPVASERKAAERAEGEFMVQSLKRFRLEGPGGLARPLTHEKKMEDKLDGIKDVLQDIYNKPNTVGLG